MLTQDSGIEGQSSSQADNPCGFYLWGGKRCADLIASACATALASPILIACACAIKLESSGPVLFRQQRVGLRGKLFTLLKFRSMRVGSERDHLKITVAEDPRVTAVGKWLRKTKLDELPQLFNVLSGDMSLIGPRPEVPEYVHQYDEAQRLVLQVKPGITGSTALAFLQEEMILKQATDAERFYRTTVMPCKLNMDLEYCRTVSFTSDLRIAYRTLASMISLLANSIGTRILVRLRQRDNVIRDNLER